MRNTLILCALVVFVAFVSPASAAEPLSRAMQQGHDEGVQFCAPAIDKMIKFVHENDDSYGMFGVWSKANPNGSMFTTTTAEVTDGEHLITTFSGARNTTATCDVVATEVITTNSTCAKFREEGLKDWKYFGDMNGSSIYSDPTIDAGSDVILTSGPNDSCVVVKRITLFGVKVGGATL